MEGFNFIEIVTSVGFPIAAYCALFYYMVTQHKNHKEEMLTLKDAISSNTVALTELKTFLEKNNV